MEEKNEDKVLVKSKKSKVITVFLCVVLFCVFSLLLLIIFDKGELFGTTICDKTTNECPKCEEKECNCPTDTACSSSNQYKEQMLSTDIGVFFVTSKGEVYYEPGTKFTTPENIEENTIISSAKKLLGNPGKYTITSNDKFADGKRDFSYKLDLSSIRYATELSFGNGGFNSTIVLVSTNGTLSELSFSDDDTGMMFNKNIKGFNNILAIVPDNSDGGIGAVAYDKCGNSYSYSSPRFD